MTFKVRDVSCYPTERHVLYGYCLLIVVCLFFTCFMFSAFVSKLLPPSGHAVIDFIIADHYYCYLLPLMIPITLFTVYLNWFGMKLFRHN